MDGQIRFLLPAILFTALFGCGGSGSNGNVSEDTPRPPDRPSTFHATAVVAPGATCSVGGVEIESGIDDNGNGQLDAAEVDVTETICNGLAGTDGQDGSPGSDGLNALVTTTVTSPGATCSAGGVQIVTGLDTNNDSVLAEGEVLDSRFVCNGNPGLNGQLGERGPAGSNGLTSLMRTTEMPGGTECSNGGTLVEAGIDADSNGVLDDSEVNDSATVCNGLDGHDGIDGRDGANFFLMANGQAVGFFAGTDPSAISAISETGYTIALESDGSVANGISTIYYQNPDCTGTFYADWSALYNGRVVFGLDPENSFRPALFYTAKNAPPQQVTLRSKYSRSTDSAGVETISCGPLGQMNLRVTTAPPLERFDPVITGFDASLISPDGRFTPPIYVDRQ